MKEKIIKLLRNCGGFILEAEIISRVGISGQELWKYVSDLRDDGYEIDLVPHLGYKLSAVPDRLLPSEIQAGLNTVRIGKRIVYFESLGSTMDEAMNLAAQGAEEGVLVISESQVSGRGRAGRNWFSPAFKGIYFSLLLRPKVERGKFALLNLMAAVAVSEAIKEITGIVTEIKWPNDILIQGRKICGILIEARTQDAAKSFVVVGVGLNVNNGLDALYPGAASLKQAMGVDIQRVTLLQEILRRMENYYAEFCRGKYALITDKWRGLNCTLGDRVRVILPNGEIEGEAVNIDEDGGLLVRRDSGLTEKIFVGDVIHCRRYYENAG